MNYLAKLSRRLLQHFQRPIEAFILVADRPMRQPGFNMKRYSRDELRQHFQFDYCEEPNYVSSTEIAHDTQPLAQQIKQRLQQPLHRQLVLCPINPEVGYGVFALKPISADTLIGVYTGIITPSRRGNTDYLMALPKHLGTEEVAWSIDANFEGNITRFIQHFPLSTVTALPEGDADCDAELLHDLTLQAAIASLQVVTANVHCQFVRINNKTLCCYITSRAILPGEQLGLSYGSGYWTSRETQPCYFNRDGEIVNLSEV